MTIVNSRCDYALFHKSLFYSDFSKAATENQIKLIRCPARTMIRCVRIRNRIAFTGGAITAYTICLGTVADPEKYASRFDVYQAAGDTTYEISMGFTGETISTFWTLYAKAFCTGADLDKATAGECHFTVEMLTM